MPCHLSVDLQVGAPVFALKSAKMLSEDSILKASGKGTYASNQHDEEVTNPEEQDFSDDEQVGARNSAGGRGGGARARHRTQR